MNAHSQAKLTALSRAEMIHRIVDLHQPVAPVAAGFGLSERCADKWLARFRAEGTAGLHDRSARPQCSPRTTAAAEGTSGGWPMGGPHPFRVARVLALRQRKRPGFQIARATKLGKATVSRLLRRQRLRLAQLSPPPPIVRSERAHPGELLHFAIKKLARIVRPGHRVTGDRQHAPVRGAGGEFLHLASDDHCCSGSLRGALRAKGIRYRVTQSRLAFAQLLPDESSGARKPAEGSPKGRAGGRVQTAASALAFLHAALAFFRKHGVSIQRVYSDNGSCYRAHARRAAVAALGLKHRFPRPDTPKTNGRSGGGDKGGWRAGERPNASSKPRGASGPPLTPIPIPTSVPLASPPSSTTRTGIALTTPSSSAPLSPDSASH